MWRLLEQAAKSATANASEYVSTVQEKAQSIVATVQDEAATLLHALGTTRIGPVDELLYEEIDAYKAFLDTFNVESRTDEIAHILSTEDDIRSLHDDLVPVQLSYDEFWSRFFFRQHQAAAAEAAEIASASLRSDSTDATDPNDLTLTANAIDDKDDADSSSAALVPNADTADRRAAKAWECKARELEQRVASLTSQLRDTTQRLEADKQADVDGLCASFDASMTEATLQLDAARAAGYDAGIRESEAIVAAMRSDADAEIAVLQQQLAAAQTTQQQTPTADESAIADVKRESELWRMRAIKMKKAKEAVDAELATAAQQLADANAAATEREDAAFARGCVAGRAEREVEVTALERAVEEAFNRGHDAASAKSQREIDLLRTELAVVRAGPTELLELETEPDVIWSVPVPVLGDEFSDTDAMSHSIDNLHSAAASDAGGASDANAWDPRASVAMSDDTGVPDAPRDDWGEW